MNKLIHKGLLWKEWRQNKGYLLAAFILLAYFPLFKPLGIIFFKGLISLPVRQMSVTYNELYRWSNDMQMIMANTSSNSFIPVTIVGLVLLGAIVLGEERKGSIDYLVTTPVSRAEIIINKYLLGLGAVVVAVLLNTWFLLLLKWGFFSSIAYQYEEVLWWAMVIGALYIAIYSLAFMVSTFSGNVLAAGVFTGFLMLLPTLIQTILMDIVSLTGPAYKTAGMTEKIFSYLYITSYLDAHSQINYHLGILLLLILAGLFLLLSIKIFTINPLEKKGELFLFGNFKHMGQIFIAFMSAFFHATTNAESILNMILLFIFYFLMVYIVIGLIYWLLSYLRVGIK